MATYEKLETRPAPAGIKGPVHWLKENLFFDIKSTILTLLSFALLYFAKASLIRKHR